MHDSVMKPVSCGALASQVRDLDGRTRDVLVGLAMAAELFADLATLFEHSHGRLTAYSSGSGELGSAVQVLRENVARLSSRNSDLGAALMRLSIQVEEAAMLEDAAGE